MKRIEASGDQFTVSELIAALQTLPGEVHVIASISMGADTFFAEQGPLDVVIESDDGPVILGGTVSYGDLEEVADDGV